MTKEETLLQLTPQEREQRNQLFEELLKRQKDIIWEQLKKLYRENPNLADECRSQLYYQLYVYLEDALTAENEEGYVVQCLKNCLNTIYAHRKKDPLVFPEWLEHYPDTIHPCVEDQADAAAIASALEQIPAMYATVFEQREQGYSYQEIADREGISCENARQRRVTARKLILSILSGLLLVILALATAMAVSPVRRFLQNYHLNDFGRGSEVSYERDFREKGYLHGRYNYLPEGYVLADETEYIGWQILVYRNADGDEIVCDTQRFREGRADIILNTENAVIEEVAVGNTEGMYLEMQNGDIALQWVTGKYVNSIFMPERLGKEELLRVAESRGP